MLPEEARYETLIRLPKGTMLGTALVEAMNAIERDFEPLAGQLPKDFEKFDNDLLESMLRIFDSEALRRASGDVFGRIYEYFLMKFAIQGAQDNGEFFTPPSIVQTIVNVIEPDHGVVADLACGSGGMFVQSSHFMEDHGQNTMDRVTFYGQEKTATTISLAKMNLAVHGLEGEIREANTFYEDEHRLSDVRPLWGNCDFMMANPPFNVDMVDAGKVKDDRRLPFGLPGVNKGKTVSNANYLWISYFHSYLNAKGRAGFVMSSQASSAGHGEAEVRRKIVETGDVDVMMSIRSNFFYTRTVPCELWFFDKGKPAARKDQVLMLDARNVYRKVTRKIYDFSAEQQQNLAAIVWLYRGENDRFLTWVRTCHAAAVTAHDRWQFALARFQDLDHSTDYLIACLHKWSLFNDHTALFPTGGTVETDPLSIKVRELKSVQGQTSGEAQTQTLCAAQAHVQYSATQQIARGRTPEKMLAALHADLLRMQRDTTQYRRALDAVQSHMKLLTDGIRIVEAELNTPSLKSQWREAWSVPRHWQKRQTEGRELKEAWLEWNAALKQLNWLLQRFPEGTWQDIPGLCKIVSRQEIAAADGSLTPGRYVGVAPAEVDEDFDFAQSMRDIHLELKDLDQEAGELAAKIQATFEGLAV